MTLIVVTNAFTTGDLRPGRCFFDSPWARWVNFANLGRDLYRDHCGDLVKSRGSVWLL